MRRGGGRGRERIVEKGRGGEEEKSWEMVWRGEEEGEKEEVVTRRGTRGQGQYTHCQWQIISKLVKKVSARRNV